MAEREEYKSAFSGTQIDSSVSRVLSNDVADTVARNNIATLIQTVSNLSAESIGAIPQYSTMPTAGAQWVNHIIQYVGTSTSGYVQGYFYICVQDGQSFAWNNIVVQRDITVDSAMSDSSTNPVQNAVITTALSNLSNNVTEVSSQVAAVINSKGAVNGIATLNSGGKVVASQACSALAWIETSGATTLTESNMGQTLICNHASDITITVPTGLPLNSEVELIRWNIGAVSISPASGVTLHSANDLRNIANRYGAAGLKHIATNIWVLTGDLG